MSQPGQQGESVQLSLHSDFNVCNFSVGTWDDAVWEEGEAGERTWWAESVRRGNRGDQAKTEGEGAAQGERENISARSEPWPELVIQTYQPSSPLFSRIETILPPEHGPFPNHRNNFADSWLTDSEEITAEREAHSSSQIGLLLTVVFIQAGAHTSTAWHTIRAECRRWRHILRNGIWLKGVSMPFPPFHR